VRELSHERVELSSILLPLKRSNEGMPKFLHPAEAV
jgi:hypothetical protein